MTALPPLAAAEVVKIGVLKVPNAYPIIIAQDKGYFAKEGLSAELVFFDAPIIVAQGVMSGDLDFGAVAMSAAFFNAAGQGKMRIIAGDGTEAPGFKASAVTVSNRAYAAGLKTLKDLGGHSFAVVAAGTFQQYTLGVIARKYGFDYASMRMLPVGSQPNMVSAVAGGSADSAFPANSVARQAIAEGKLHNIGWLDDEIRVQVGVAFTSAKKAERSPDLVRRFVTVFRAGLRDYHDAFIGADERPHDGPTAAATYSLIAKYIGLPVDTVQLTLGHADAEGRLNVADVMDQIAWYKSQGLVKPEVDGSKIIDTRYVVPLREKESSIKADPTQ
jgi:NitT/TauT family transport system substrate-binding protein